MVRLPIVFMWKYKKYISAKPEVELIFAIVPMEISFIVKYLENGDRYVRWGQK